MDWGPCTASCAHAPVTTTNRTTTNNRIIDRFASHRILTHDPSATGTVCDALRRSRVVGHWIRLSPLRAVREVGGDACLHESGESVCLTVFVAKIRTEVGF